MICNAGDGAVIWQEALTFVAGLNSGTYKCGVTTPHNDWRLPTVNELETLINYQENTCEWLQNQGFINVKTVVNGVNVYHKYWSSTTFALNTSAAWEVDFTRQIYIWGMWPKDNCGTTYVWPVRGPVTGN